MINRIAFASLLVLLLTVVACGGNNNNEEPDADQPPPPPSCQSYCDTVMASCEGNYAQYADAEACLAFCNTTAAWELGEAGDNAGNSVGCRTYHATAAAADPGTHCPHAGPSGGNVCGSWCDNYCQMALKSCGDLYEDETACQAACAGLAATGNPGDNAGDTVQCRLYHAAAAAADPATHCPHVAEDGGGVCVDQ